MPPDDHPRVTTWLKSLLMLALVVPMAAYVAGSLASSPPGPSTDRGPVIIDVSTSPAPDGRRRTRGTPVRTTPDRDRADDVVPGQIPAPSSSDDRDDDSGHDRSTRVVTPAPTTVDVLDPVGEDDGAQDDRDEDAGSDTDVDADDDKDADDGRGDDADDDRDIGDSDDDEGSGSSGSSGSGSSNSGHSGSGSSD